MSQAEFTAFSVQMRTRFDNGAMSAEDAFRCVWDPERSLSHEQREELHRVLELPFDPPSDFRLLIPTSDLQ